eukprot:6028_1
MKKLNMYIDLMLKKLSTTEAKSLLGVFVLLGVIAIIWIKVERAKERERNRRRGRNGGRNPARPHNIPNDLGQQQQRLSPLFQTARDEIRRLTAKQRYLESKNWENQCICLCLEQLINRDLSNNTVSFKSTEIVSLLKELARKHRLYIIHLLPFDIRSKLDNDKPGEQSTYESDVIQLFVKNEIVKCGLPKHKILFCTTQKGKSSMVRQLMPTLYIDSDEVVLKELHQHLTEVVQVTSLLGAGGVAPTVFVTTSVQAYFV